MRKVKAFYFKETCNWAIAYQEQNVNLLIEYFKVMFSTGKRICSFRGSFINFSFSSSVSFTTTKEVQQLILRESNHTRLCEKLTVPQRIVFNTTHFLAKGVRKIQDND